MGGFDAPGDRALDLCVEFRSDLFGVGLVAGVGRISTQTAVWVAQARRRGQWPPAVEFPFAVECEVHTD